MLVALNLGRDESRHFLWVNLLIQYTVLFIQYKICKTYSFSFKSLHSPTRFQFYCLNDKQ